MRPRTLSATTLLKEPVHDIRDERIGKIEDYMVDLEGGCIEYAVLSFGGFLGIGSKLFAIPWNSMQLDTDRHVWTLDVTEDRLKQAPGFDKDNWPDMSDTQYRDSIQSFWAANTRGSYPGIHGSEGSGMGGGSSSGY